MAGTSGYAVWSGDGGVGCAVGGMAVGFGEGFVIAVRDLLLSVAAGRPASPSFLDGLRAAEVVAAAQRSAAGRCWQAVDRLDVEAPAAGQ